MEMAEFWLNIAGVLAMVWLMVNLVWQWKSKNSYSCQMALIINYAALAAIEIGLAIVGMLNGEIFVHQILVACLLIFLSIFLAVKLDWHKQKD